MSLAGFRKSIDWHRVESYTQKLTKSKKIESTNLAGKDKPYLCVKKLNIMTKTKVRNHDNMYDK